MATWYAGYVNATMDSLARCASATQLVLTAEEICYNARKHMVNRQNKLAKSQLSLLRQTFDVCSITEGELRGWNVQGGECAPVECVNAAQD